MTPKEKAKIIAEALSSSESRSRLGEKMWNPFCIRPSFSEIVKGMYNIEPLPEGAFVTSGFAEGCIEIEDEFDGDI